MLWHADCRMKRKRKEKWVPEKEKIIYRTLQQVNLIVEEHVFCQALFPKKSVRIPCF